MTIRPIVTIEPIRAGVAVRASEIGLACHGRDQERAMAAMRVTLGIWVKAITEVAPIEQVLARLGVVWDDNGTGISVEPSVSAVSC